MIAFFKGKAVSQVDEILIEGKKYTRADLIKLIRGEK